MSKKIKDINKYKEDKAKQQKEEIHEEKCPICNIVDSLWGILYEERDEETFRTNLHVLLYNIYKQGLIDNTIDQINAGQDYLKYLLTDDLNNNDLN